MHENTGNGKYRYSEFKKKEKLSLLPNNCDKRKQTVVTDSFCCRVAAATPTGLTVLMTI